LLKIKYTRYYLYQITKLAKANITLSVVVADLADDSFELNGIFELFLPNKLWTLPNISLLEV